MNLRKFVSLLLTILGALSLLFAAVCLGLGLFESATIPATQYKDPALGYTFAPIFAVIGLALYAIGKAIRGKHRASR
ncbi:membrane protein DedA with SNARE-associated domain [Lysobacter niastensis]|uniref:Membrane protein DedA with SNARE-associated domain n=1 Tax=Lysobacter niastensis TaxID=380629 RepID=A0ABU1W5Q8_9GAMM|nr:hypothetical protein [Lysobacter niastensis]MDR7132834.1 membrane protein DedA with SNARE-associated domain [Lysobacter niastensis]